MSLSLFILAFLGHIANVSIIVAPHYAVYQHYLPWTRLAAEASAVSLVILALQAVVTTVLVLRERTELWRAFRRIPLIAVVATLGILSFSAATPTESVMRALGEWVLSMLLMIFSLGTLVLAVWYMPVSALTRARRMLAAKLTLTDADTAARPWDRRLPRALAVWTLVVTAAIAIFAFERMPHIDDSVAYLFQAKYFSTGSLWLPRPSDPGAFAVGHLIVDGDEWYSKFFPGWPALLALGVIAGTPWLVNPVLSAITVLVLHGFLRRVYGLRTAHAGTLLLSASPWFLFLGGSFMAHTTSLFCMVIALYGIERIRGRRVNGWGVLAGAALGLLFLTRPFDAALIGPVVGLSALGIGAKRLSLGGLVAVGMTSALVAALYFPYNYMLTGSMSTAPHRLWADHLFGPNVDVFGFGPNVGIPLWRNADPLPGHGPADIILNANKNFQLLNFDLFGWACGSLIFAGLILGRGALDKRHTLMAGLLLAVVLGHCLYWAPGGPDFGARYWYVIIVPLIVFTVRGAEYLAGLQPLTHQREGIAGMRVVSAIAFLCLTSVLIQLPWQGATKYRGYRDISGELRRLASDHGIEDALVFIRSSRRSDYQMAFNLNPRTLDDDGTVFAWDRGPEQRAQVVAQFPARPVWLIERMDDAPNSNLVVTQGPLPPGMNPSGEAPPLPDPMQAVLR